MARRHTASATRSSRSDTWIVFILVPLVAISTALLTLLFAVLMLTPPGV